MFYEIFTKLCNEKDISPTATLQNLKISTSKLTAWKNGSLPSASVLILLSEYFQVSIDYLLKGKEKNTLTIGLTADEQELLEYFSKLSDKSKGIILGKAETLVELEKPVADETTNETEPEESRLKINCSTYQVSAGAGFELGEGDEWYEIEVPDTLEARKANFALQIKGNSMEPIYFDGDIVLVKEQPSVDLGQIGIFDIEGKGYIKKFGGDRLISLNAEYDDIVFSDYDEDRIHCFGKVIGRV